MTEARRAEDAQGILMESSTVPGVNAHGQAGYCHLKLGDTQRASRHLREAIHLQSEPRSREAALRHALLATSFLQPKHLDLDEAVVHGHYAVDILLGEIDSPRCAGHVAGMARLLTRHQRHQPVRDLLDRARPLLVSPAM